ncbi:DUF1214 domain-containing protein [Kordiimonas sp. SCSIO 12610]|uniref:DUF1214 domain-containing protein n=1 Tax=Kordiimonas sp. SCSIO 12610 TaxID=2829597 RepID=UPI00210E7D0C|nr:DUF1214 domain-containing protein [Kordiimonas sp. SCSIO 12610]UTW56120.1 DUF1214 domain-containing protein [Kordiimonas sp. SCSIO 12610]
MKRIIAIISTITIGLMVGGVSALYMAGLVGGKSPAAFADVTKDDWSSDWSIGSKAADPYVRARVARHGLLALAKEEAVYFTRAVDSEGAQLRGDCTYELAGTGQDAYWWSITLYDGKSRLPMNSDNALSIDATLVAANYEADTSYNGNWSAIVSNTRPKRDKGDHGDALWISSKGAESFDLMIRLYRPSDAVLARPTETLNPPTIKRLSCGTTRAGDGA